MCYFNVNYNLLVLLDFLSRSFASSERFLISFSSASCCFNLSCCFILSSSAFILCCSAFILSSSAFILCCSASCCFILCCSAFSSFSFCSCLFSSSVFWGRWTIGDLVSIALIKFLSFLYLYECNNMLYNQILK